MRDIFGEYVFVRKEKYSLKRRKQLFEKEKMEV